MNPADTDSVVRRKFRRKDERADFTQFVSVSTVQVVGVFNFEWLP
jgi:hypothetical protein